MVRRSWFVLLVVVAAVMALAAGCVDSSEEAAQTPSSATTVGNRALQTDSQGNTVTAPAETAPAAGGGGGGEQAGGGGGGESAQVEAGLQVFSQNCTTCHTDNGQQAGVGPQLAGAGLDEQTIRTTVQNGRGIMPAGLVSGEDLDNVVAYVLSIQ
jgi:cytochrome c551